MNWDELLAAIAEAQSLPTIEEMTAKLAEIADKVKAAIEQATEDSVEQAENVLNALAAAKEKINKRAKVYYLSQRANEFATAMRPTVPLTPPAPVQNAPQIREVKRPTNMYKDIEDARTVGYFLQFACGDRITSQRAEMQLQKRNFQVRTMTEGNNASAGLLVPEPMADAIWWMREQYGQARRLATVVNMSGPTMPLVKCIGDGNAYFVGETGATTASDLVFQNFTLVAKTLAAPYFYSRELDEDAIVPLADLVTQSLGQQFVEKEDSCYFIGDGTSTYGQMMGFTNIYRQILEAAGGTWTNDTHKANLGSLYVQATGTTPAGLTRTDLSAVTSRAARYAGVAFSWVMHPSIWADIVQPLIIAVGGATAGDIATGAEPRLFGYPVILSEAMPTSAAVTSNTVYILFGDFAKASWFGVRRDVTVESQSTGSNFSNRIVEVLGVQRFGTLIHDVGNYSTSATTRKRGAVAAISTRNS